MMRFLLFGLVALLAPAALTPGTPFPAVEAETLAGAKLRLPDAAKGKPALVVITFSKEAGDASKAWCTRFVKDNGQLYQIAMLEKAPRLVRGLIKRGMRGDMPPALQARMLLLFQGEAAWRKTVGVTNDALPVLVTLDAEGRITWSHQGAFDEAQYQKLRQHAL
ncbi:MAG: hypothetical protein K2X03_02675 [Bryobacteraceae bacterium]|nr:hypothetical protein [Bryobacteraceae bacterium]